MIDDGRSFFIEKIAAATRMDQYGICRIRAELRRRGEA